MCVVHCTHTWAPPKFQQGGKVFFFQGGTTKNDLGRGLFLKLRAQAGRGEKEHFSSAGGGFLEKIMPKVKKVYKLAVF